MSPTTTLTVRDTVERNLADEPQSVIKVYETGRLRTDIVEYVLTDRLAGEFGKVLERVVESAHPAGAGTDKVGIWVSGFFGSGKSHFAKLAGHLLADTRIGNDSTRDLFRQLLHMGRKPDEHLRELLQQATTYKLNCHLVLFDMTALHSVAADKNVGITFLRAFYDSLGLSKVIAFAERELELQAADKYEAFLSLYEAKAGVAWDEDKDLTTSSALFAECLSELLPNRFSTVDLAHRSLELAFADETNLNIDGIVDRLVRWLEFRQKLLGSAPLRLVFVADEVGAWAGRDLGRIEQIRSMVEVFGAKGRGRIWIIATSQEKLSAVVQNAPTQDTRAAQELLQRLEARFQTNVHLESSEVGSVIEDRVLRKKPTARPDLERLWTSYQQQLRDIGEPPGLELGANYIPPDRDHFVKDYPFLPYQIPASADIFGGMRSVKVSSGARSMIKTVFDATRSLADRKLGTVVSWDQIFDSANRDNEFADEQYLGSQGLTYLGSADQHVTGVPVTRPSRLLKILWLIQQSNRIPRTVKNLARLLVNDLDEDVLQLEKDVEKTLEALTERDFVRMDVTTGQWKFLTQDEVTAEKIVRRLSGEVKQKEIRDETFKLYSKQLQALFNGRITAGKSNTPFEYGVYLNDSPLKNEEAPVKLQAALEGTSSAQRAEASIVDLDDPTVYWVVELAPKLEERLRRAVAIGRVESDEEYRQIATERTKQEAEKLILDADVLRSNIESDVARVFQGGTIYWAGNTLTVTVPTNGGHSSKGAQPQTARSKVEEALRDRIAAKYYRFAEGDKQFNPANIDKLFVAAAGDRAALDPGLAIFDAEGHVHGNNVVVEELSSYLRSSTKTDGQSIINHFSAVPYGWPSDLLRYVAAAMFIDGKLSAKDPAGKTYDDPKASGARNLFGTAAFKNTRLEVEEESLTPEESTQARTLLTDLGQAPTDGGEVALKEATQSLCTNLTKRLGVLGRARDVGFPLPSSYDKIPIMLEEITGAGSRVKVIRALLAQTQDMRDAKDALTRLEHFDSHAGFRQYRRSQQLLGAALQAGLAEDPAYADKVQTATDEIQALKEQRRVLDEWDGAFQKYRLDVLEAFRYVYTPLREELHKRSEEANRAVTEMAEYKALNAGDRALVRTQFLGEGRPLYEVSLPELKNEEQLIAANSEYSIAHLRSALAALDSQLSQAKARVIQLYTEEQRRKGEEAKTAVWKPAEAFAGKRFTTETQIETALDAEKERLKALVREGKTVQVV